MTVLGCNGLRRVIKIILSDIHNKVQEFFIHSNKLTAHVDLTFLQSILALAQGPCLENWKLKYRGRLFNLTRNALKCAKQGTSGNKLWFIIVQTYNSTRLERPRPKPLGSLIILVVNIYLSSESSVILCPLSHSLQPILKTCMMWLKRLEACSATTKLKSSQCLKAWKSLKRSTFNRCKLIQEQSPESIQKRSMSHRNNSGDIKPKCIFILHARDTTEAFKSPFFQTFKRVAENGPVKIQFVMLLYNYWRERIIHTSLSILNYNSPRPPCVEI